MWPVGLPPWVRYPTGHLSSEAARRSYPAGVAVDLRTVQSAKAPTRATNAGPTVSESVEPQPRDQFGERGRVKAEAVRHRHSENEGPLWSLSCTHPDMGGALEAGRATGHSAVSGATWPVGRPPAVVCLITTEAARFSDRRHSYRSDGCACQLRYHAFHGELHFVKGVRRQTGYTAHVGPSHYSDLPKPTAATIPS